MENRKYIINGKTYNQRPLVLGQLEPLEKLIMGVQIVDLSPSGILQALGSRLPQAAAIILNPEGVRLRDKDIDALADEFAEYLELETALEVAADFLSCNSLLSISSRSKALVTTIWEMMQQRRQDGSKAS